MKKNEMSIQKEAAEAAQKAHPHGFEVRPRELFTEGYLAHAAKSGAEVALMRELLLECKNVLTYEQRANEAEILVSRIESFLTPGTTEIIP